MQLSQKERMMLEDEKSHEELCIKKYGNYAQQAKDPELKQLFTKIGQHEQMHYDTINQILQGQQPSMNQGQQAQQMQQGQQQTQQAQMQQGQQAQQMQQAQQGQQNMAGKQSAYEGAMASEGDKTLCNDMLSTEKYISGTYDTVIFESANPATRQALQHIQQEEQKHGEDLFNYMNSHGMYNVK